MSLASIGYNEVADLFDSELLKEFAAVRVIAVHRESYIVSNGDKEIPAEITGRMIGRAESPLDYPSVGDWAYAQLFDDDSLAIIHQLLPRRTLLKRKTSGRKVDFQLIAANVDIAFIVQSLDRDFSVRRLERYLAMVRSAQIQPVVLLSKKDLIEESLSKDFVAEILTVMPELTILPFSNVTGSGLPEIEACLQPGKTCCLMGSSGVGKTSLLNALIGDQGFKTGEVRAADQRGRHTTTTRQMILLRSQALLIDTPGMRELGNFEIEEGIEATFPEISELIGQCHFNIHIGITPQEFWDHRADLVLPERNTAIDPQGAARRRMALRHRQFRLFHIGENAHAALIKGFPFLGRRELACRPVQQPDAQAILQPANLFAHRRGCQL